MSSARASVPPQHHVLILGGGFAGLRCAMELASHAELQITLIDKQDYQQFQPLLYQVAASLLGPEDAAFSFRDLLGSFANVDIWMDEVTSLDLATRTVHTRSGRSASADFVVLAVGSEVNFFGVPGAAEYALPLYSLHEAEALRSRILRLFEAADASPVSGDGQLHMVIVGGGPTGVELAGTLSDMLVDVLGREFRHVDAAKAGVTLVERGPALLAMFSEESRQYALTALRERGVDVRVEANVTEVGADFVGLADGSRVACGLVIWSAGIHAVGVPLSPEPARQRNGRLDVAPDLSLAGYPGIFAAGDVANAADSAGQPLPQLAAVAQQAGRHCANNIVALAKGKPTTHFTYSDRGILAMIGRNAAVAELGSVHHRITGTLAYAIWLAVHAALLTTTRARIEAVFEWAWNYFTRQRPAQFIDR